MQFSIGPWLKSVFFGPPESDESTRAPERPLPTPGAECGPRAPQKEPAPELDAEGEEAPEVQGPACERGEFLVHSCWPEL